MSSVDSISEDVIARAEELKNKANDFFKGTHCTIITFVIILLWYTKLGFHLDICLVSVCVCVWRACVCVRMCCVCVRMCVHASECVY